MSRSDLTVPPCSRPVCRGGRRSGGCGIRRLRIHRAGIGDRGLADPGNSAGRRDRRVRQDLPGVETPGRAAGMAGRRMVSARADAGHPIHPWCCDVRHVDAGSTRARAIPRPTDAQSSPMLPGHRSRDIGAHGAHLPTRCEAAVWSASYREIAIPFGVGVLGFDDAEMDMEYFARLPDQGHGYFRDQKIHRRSIVAIPTIPSCDSRPCRRADSSGPARACQ